MVAKFNYNIERALPYLIIELHQNPILPTYLFIINFCKLSKFKINWIVFARTFSLALNKLSNLRKIWILSINQSNVKINKEPSIGQSGCSYYHCHQTSASKCSSLRARFFIHNSGMRMARM